MVRPSEVSSWASSLAELVDRVTRAAETQSAAGRDDLATELFAVERSLKEALRRLQRLR